MHQDWGFNSTTAEKRSAYNNVTKVTQTMRDISPDSGAYVVSNCFVQSVAS